jgi:Na+-transporting NADH:ubiquinone oxidoreductase subunit NqrB
VETVVCLLLYRGNISLTCVQDASWKLGVGVTVTTVVFSSVGSKLVPGENKPPMYYATQWTAFDFGVFATALGILCFRVVGAVGYHSPKPSSISDSEKGDPL